jgi:hypothetical protein
MIDWAVWQAMVSLSEGKSGAMALPDALPGDADGNVSGGVLDNWFESGGSVLPWTMN